MEDQTQRPATPAEAAMKDICENLERFFDGHQSPELALAAVCKISGRYKMQSIGSHAPR